MPFEVMRRQQKKILAFLAILAMFLFTIDMSIMPLITGMGSASGDKTIATLNGKALRSSDLAKLNQERQIANEFVMAATQGLVPGAFGGYTDRDQVDAYILNREADRLGLPGGVALGEKYLREALPSMLPETLRGIYGQAFTVNQRRFEQIRAQRLRQYAGEQILASIGNQYRLLLARSMVGGPQVTPLDVFEGYRDRSELVTADFAKFSVADYVSKVPEPSETELKSYFEAAKDILPDPDSPKPGFKVPRKVQVAYATIDIVAMEERLRDELKKDGTAIRDAFNARKADLVKQVNERIKMESSNGLPPSALPIDLFALPADDPQQTQARLEDFADELAAEIARDRARETAESLFDQLENKVVDPYVSAYDDAINKKQEELENSGKAEKDGDSPTASVTPPPETLMGYGLSDSLKDLLAKLGVAAPQPLQPSSALVAALKSVAAPLESKGLKFTVAGPTELAKLQDFGPIADSVTGSEYPAFGERDQSTPFASEIFDESRQLYSLLNFVDSAGRRYRGWKIQDEAPRIPSFEEARPQVLSAWKLNQARALAKADAEALAKTAREKDGDLRAVAGERPIETIPASSRLQATPDPTNPFGPSIVRASAIHGVDRPGEAFRDALFGLTKGQIAVAPDAPEDDYYVLAGTGRHEVSVAQLFDTLNQREASEIQQQVIQDETRDRIQRWMAELRRENGLPDNWEPADEAAGKGQRSNG